MKKGGKKLFKKIKWGLLILSFIAAFATELLGSLFTTPGVKSFWYLTVRPDITPPGWVFAVVWNILFFLLFISMYLALSNAKTKKEMSKTEILFGINLILNFLWSFLFFGLRNPFLGFADIILLFISTFILVYFNWKRNKLSAFLLIPYLLWLAFAALLNFLSTLSA